MGDTDDAVRQFEAKCAELEKLRDEVREQAEAKDRFKYAATSAAATSIRAIEEIQSLEKVVNAALVWREAIELPSAAVHQLIVAERGLRNAVDAHLVQIKKRS